MTDKLKITGLTLTDALKSVGLSKSSYYYKPKTQRPRALDPRLSAELEKLTGYELTYGYRKVTEYFKRYNHKKVLRHMQRLKMTQPRKIKGVRFTVLPYTPPTKSNERWEVDLTYVPFGLKECAALFTIVDCFDKEVIGDNFSRFFTANESRVALDKAVFSRFPIGVPKELQLVVRVDRGSQFIAKIFKEAAKLSRLNIQFYGIQCPNDKPYIESFVSKYKTEEVYRNCYETYDVAKNAWLSYKFWYNNRRLHQSIGYQTPSRFARLSGAYANLSLPMNVTVKNTCPTGLVRRVCKNSCSLHTKF